MATQNPLTPGVTPIGTPDRQNILYVPTVAVANKPSIIGLDSVNASTGARTTYYLWVDSAGSLRIHTSVPTDEDSDGTVVGAQTAPG